MPTPLPPLANLFQGEEAVRTAYARILPLENSNLMLIRILGWMLIHAPHEAGRAYVARCINQCQDDPQIIEEARYHLQYFVKYFKTIANKPTPTPSNDTMGARRDIILASIDQAPTSHSQAKDRALVRDNYRCQLTGHYDDDAYSHIPAVRQESDAAPAGGIGPTECHHILPQYVGHHIADNELRRINAATIWSIVTAYGGIVPAQVNGAGIHNLRNIMTLRSDIHKAFDHLSIWLEPIEGLVNAYNVGRIAPRLCPDVPQVVTLTTSTPLPLPDPRYLALQAACAKVIHMSGAAESIHLILRDMEDTLVLSQDGSSAGLLETLLYGQEQITMFEPSS
ncbi:HNH endonuclease [Rhizoctonia solani 123E]|uniref:HNH endonuclease n=1 Tax=Rhizoctonia solani 123E TaxID=1423351 RepID=A0A074RUG6_9AGAM|nr:HNH endonuclease [Rhizoctonia solani 123E]